MNYRLLFLLAALIITAITFVVAAAWRRPSRLLVLLTAFSLTASAQTWSPFLDSSRATNWTGAGFTIPNYTSNCAIQPVLVANSSAAAAVNAIAIQSALNSCDATHNVVNVPAGTWYVAGFHYGAQGKQVLRGAGSNSTFLISTSEDGCGGLSHAVCMIDGSPSYNGSAQNLPGGANACSWTAGYAKSSTTITLSSCGTAPPLHQTMILDQANDTSDTDGVYICDTNIAGCGYEGSSGGNNDGRFISGVTHSQQQVTYVTGVTSLGGGSYTVTISPGVYFSNVRAGQNPGAWWPGFVQNDGLENLSIDSSADPDGALTVYDCYQCWVKGVRFLNSGRNSIMPYQSAQDVVRDSYFYGSQGTGSESYALEFEIASGLLIENNIFQQVTTPVVFGAGTGNVLDYNFSTFVNYGGNGGNGAYASHNAGSEMNLFEGNNFFGIWADDAWGASDQATFFRNMLQGWQNGKTMVTVPVILRSYVRAFNIVGNVMGQPGYHTFYQEAATSTSTYTPTGGEEQTAIYSLGTPGIDACSAVGVTCDAKVPSTLMRWGNWDVVTNGTKWDSTEASPAAVPYLNANFSSSYFGSLAHSLPASLYYSSTPSWWPSGKAWPPVGPDVSSGNVGICTGTYSGAQGTNSSQCMGGTLNLAWASHVTSTPAQDCYLSMGGHPDGTGSPLNFDANSCYTSSGTTNGTGPASPSGLTALVQ